MRFFIYCLTLLIAAPAPAQSLGQPIIDMHMHSHAADRFGKAGIPNPATGKPSAAQSDEALLNAARAAMNRFNIRRSVAFSARTPTLRWVAADARFIGGTQIDVGIPMPDLAQLRQDIRAGRIKVIGEVGAQYLGLAPNDQALQPYYDLAEEFDLPVGIHTGIAEPGAPYQCCPKFRIGYGRPALLEELLVQRPTLRVYLQHAGHPFLEETVAIMSVYPQVYADISVINWVLPESEFYGYIEALMRAGLGKRLMFGSDQMIWPESIGLAVDRVQRAPFLTDEQKRDVFYNNAARFLKLTPEQTAQDHRR